MSEYVGLLKRGINTCLREMEETNGSYSSKTANHKI